MNNLTQVGRYRIKSLIGRGGMAEVYLAHDPKFNREVAIKLILAGQAVDAMSRARFEREARVIASLEHKSILPVYDMGETNGQPYLVMRYVTGGSMEQRLKRGPYSVAEIAAILPGIASALDYAHGRGVVHRDLKPANILFSAEGEAFLADFGLAKDLQGTLMLTSAGETMGTPAYMSPEQIKAVPDAPPDSRSDIYSLGVLLFHALSGKLPFESNSVFGMMDAHMRAPVPDICSVKTDLPKSLQTLFVKAMAKNPNDRYATAQALNAALNAAMNESLPVAYASKNQSKPAISPPQQQNVPSHSKATMRRGLLLGGGGLMLLGAGVALFPYLSTRLAAPTPEPSLAPIKPTETTRGAAAITNEPPTSVANTPVAPTRLPIATSRPTAVEQVATITPVRPTVPPQPTTTVGSPASVITLAPGVNIQLVRVPAGAFIMGSDKTKDPLANDDELPQHRLNLAEYWISKTKVTVAQFAAFVKATAYQSAASNDMVDKANHPVVDVNWHDCIAFCKWASTISKVTVALPSEAEWEKAARGSDGRLYPWGNEAPDATRCNFNSEVGDTTPVGKFGARGASPYGCDDMAGNVWEWTRSNYAEYPYKAEDGRETITNPTERVLRAGSFEEGPAFMRCASRYLNDPNIYTSLYGFRVVVARLPSP